MEYKFAINDVVVYKPLDLKGVVLDRIIYEGNPVYKVHFDEDENETDFKWETEDDLVLAQCFFDNHYKGEVQPIEIMQAQMTPEAFMGFLRGNIIKYACRVGKKDGVEKETSKILRYAQWLHEAALGNKIDPRA